MKTVDDVRLDHAIADHLGPGEQFARLGDLCRALISEKRAISQQMANGDAHRNRADGDVATLRGVIERKDSEIAALKQTGAHLGESKIVAEANKQRDEAIQRYRDLREWGAGEPARLEIQRLRARLDVWTPLFVAARAYVLFLEANADMGNVGDHPDHDHKLREMTRAAIKAVSRNTPTWDRYEGRGVFRTIADALADYVRSATYNKNYLALTAAEHRVAMAPKVVVEDAGKPHDTQKKPKHVHGRVGAWDAVIAYVVSDGTREASNDLVPDMRKRDMLGRERYGTPLQPLNGRDTAKDLYDELLDAVVYAANLALGLAIEKVGRELTLSEAVHVLRSERRVIKLISMAYSLKLEERGRRGG